jgi:hypothetical protein
MRWGWILCWLPLAALGCEGEDLPGRAFGEAPVAVGEVAERVLHPAGFGRVEGAQRDIHGEAGQIPCGSCHALHNREPIAQTTEELDLFHKNLVLEHGDLRCGSCHAPQDKDQLRLADGALIGFEEVVSLCGQCHGPQRRDFLRGAHGGMQGHWDLRQGERTRSSCVTCHAPHQPAYPRWSPVFAPRDRFLGGEHHQEGGP